MARKFTRVRSRGVRSVLVLALAAAVFGCNERNVTILNGGAGDGSGSGGGDGSGDGGSGDGGSGDGGSGGGSMDVNADLVAVDIVPVLTGLEAGESTTVTVSVRNDGPDDVPSFRVAAYLSSDTLLDSSDPRLSSWTSAGLAEGQSFQSSGAVQVPVTTAIGTYRLLLVADDEQALDETDETNNVAVSAQTIQVAEASHPDLVVSSVGFGPASVEAGETVDVSDVVRNSGIEPSSSFRVGIYLSADAVVTSADLLIGQRSVNGLAVGTESSASGPMTVPMFVPAGTYFVGAVADDLGVIVEMDETNNGGTSSSTLTVSAAPLPDLTPQFVTFSPITVDAGQPLIVEDAVLNQGVNTSPLFQIGLYLSEDAEIDPDEDILLGSRSVPNLAVGGSSVSGPTAMTIPGSTAGGDYFVGVVVDAGEFVPESDEGNNTLLSAGRVTVTVPPLPDLAAQSFAFSPQLVTAGSGTTLTISDDIANLGVADSAPVRVAVYLSSDAAVTTNDIVLGTHDLAALAPGAGSGITLDLPVPGGIPTGSYRVGLWVDDDGQQPELDEGNNLLVATALLDVTGGGPATPNLVAELIDAPLQIAAPGDSFQVVSRVGNQGTASSTPFRIGVYLSSDATVDATDIQLGDRLVPFGLGAGFASVASGPVTIPISTPEGIYTLALVADWQELVMESDESDNVLIETSTFEVRIPPPPMPDLFISDVTITPPAVVSPGVMLDVVHTIRNGGDVDAGPFRVGFYLSDDDVIDTADTFLASRDISALSANASDSTTTAVQIPAQTAVGPWFVGIFVDDLGTVTEGDEGNNGRARQPAIDVQ